MADDKPSVESGQLPCRQIKEDCMLVRQMDGRHVMQRTILR